MRLSLRSARAAIASVAIMLLSTAPLLAAGFQGMGVVLIHGKSGDGSNLGPLAAALASQGVALVQPQMSWTRSYRTYDETMQEIDGQVAALQARGASRIVVIGHSLGANVAVGYGARRGGLAGIVALAPGHWPEAPSISAMTRESLGQAKAMMAAGRGGEAGSFLDVNQGEVFPITTTAAAYASFFDPRGPATFTGNAGRVRAPLLWVIGTEDRPAQRAAGKGGRRSRTIYVPARHGNTPRVAVEDVMAWLAAL